MNAHMPPLLDPREVARCFGAASATYDAAASLQAEVRAELLSRLDLLASAPAAVLDLGAGTGQGALQIKRRFRRATVTAADIAAPMVRQARRRSRLWRPILEDARGPIGPCKLRVRTGDFPGTAPACERYLSRDAAIPAAPPVVPLRRRTARPTSPIVVHASAGAASPSFPALPPSATGARAARGSSRRRRRAGSSGQPCRAR